MNTSCPERLDAVPTRPTGRASRNARGCLHGFIVEAVFLVEGLRDDDVAHAAIREHDSVQSSLLSP
jgi:hypothetical protein